MPTWRARFVRRHGVASSIICCGTPLARPTIAATAMNASATAKEAALCRTPGRDALAAEDQPAVAQAKPPEQGRAALGEVGVTPT
jgi:hypothetical protein